MRHMAAKHISLDHNILCQGLNVCICNKAIICTTLMQPFLQFEV